jgi:DNA-directed RNA polymerase subunit RPC12/RpoP
MEAIIYTDNIPFDATSNLPMIRYKCLTCGNTCLQHSEPNNSVCGGCSNPNWKIMKIQQSYVVNVEDWIHPLGEV